MKKDTRKGDRHRPGYWVEYGRKRRAKEREAKASKSVKINHPSAN